MLCRPRCSSRCALGKVQLFGVWRCSISICKIDGFTQFKRFEPTRTWKFENHGDQPAPYFSGQHCEMSNGNRDDFHSRSKAVTIHLHVAVDASCLKIGRVPGSGYTPSWCYCLSMFITFFQPTTFPFPFVNLLSLESLEFKTL